MDLDELVEQIKTHINGEPYPNEDIERDGTFFNLIDQIQEDVFIYLKIQMN
jgi:hypothetical protein